MSTQQRPPIVMTFSASDPSGGAGLQADLLTCASMGCHALTVTTGVTVQDTSGVESIEPVEAEVLEDQARLLLEDMPVEAFKIGLLGSVENIQVIAEIVADYPDIPLVLDPVLASGRGDSLTDDDQRAALCELLLPQTTVLTPNSIEARQLAAMFATHIAQTRPAKKSKVQQKAKPDESEDESPDSWTLDLCAQKLLAMGCEYVLITGTHEATTEVINSLYTGRTLLGQDRWPRLPASYHGSGCTLAAAIAAMLACGMDVPKAIREAQEYTWQALAHGFQPGMGQHIPDRLFWARQSYTATPAAARF